MFQAQLKKEYAAIMLQADKASGRREAMDLYKKAYSIRKRLHKAETECSEIHNG